MGGYLGLDLGDRRIGVALSRTGIVAGALETYSRTSLAQDISHLAALAKSNGVQTIVAGLPLHLNGSQHTQSEKNEPVLQGLREQGFTVVYHDERLTSKQAERVLISADVSRDKRKQKLDQLAAVLILQGYLDALQHSL